VFDLKIEEFKPEFAGKMNLYLSTVDDLLWHHDDEPSIGVILCKGRSEIVVEYALRGTSRSVSRNIGSRRHDLISLRMNCLVPTSLLGMPLPSLLELRVEIERALEASPTRRHDSSCYSTGARSWSR
jgi:hypothetical protein